MTNPLNIADRLRDSAKRYPFQRAVVIPAGRDSAGRVTYSHFTFEQLDQESDQLASGLINWGVKPQTRLIMFVRPGLEFVALTFAAFKAGATVVLIDPGMGGRNILDCLETIDSGGFIAIPIAQAIRTMYSSRYPNADFNVTVGGRRWFWGGLTYDELKDRGTSDTNWPETKSTDPAAIIFTSGSTGPPKGVLYEHGMFDAQVDLLRDFYDIQPGEVDLPGFPLFALFNSAMGVTTVIPDMDPTKPAQVDPKKIVEAIRDQGVTQAFGSPAIWNVVGRYCEENGIELPSIKRVLSAGAPVPNHVCRRMTKILTGPDADLFTPYGATESLPVASIGAREVLDTAAKQTSEGAGTCVGRIFPNMSVKIIEICNEPIPTISDGREVTPGEIGEIIIQGAPVTREYFKRPEATAAAKIADGENFWHRIGDVGYFDGDGLLWFCGRKAHIVEVDGKRMFTVRCEAIFNEHPAVYRCALVGVGEQPNQTPVIVVELETSADIDPSQLISELRKLGQANSLTAAIEHFLIHPALPVDIRHNVKINREQLVPWAASRLG